MTIDEGIKKIAEEQFPGFSYLFDDLNNIDQAIGRLPLPAIGHVLPISGTMELRNGRVYDTENVWIMFIDKVTRDANGDDQREVFERMKDVAIEFVRRCNESGYFEPITVWSYGVNYNQMASIVTGVTLGLNIKGHGLC